MSNLMTTRNFWNPWDDEMSKFQRSVDRMFNEGMLPSKKFSTSMPEFNPSCDVEETDSHYLFSFDIPGVSKNDLKIELMDNRLMVSGERKFEHTEKKHSSRLNERFYGNFQRVFTLPSSVDAEKAEASYENGVLRIAIRKEASAKNRSIKITEGKGTEILKKLSA